MVQHPMCFTRYTYNQKFGSVSLLQQTRLHRQFFRCPPSEPPPVDITWFPLTKKQVMSNRALVNTEFQRLLGYFLLPLLLFLLMD